MAERFCSSLTAEAEHLAVKYVTQGSFSSYKRELLYHSLYPPTFPRWVQHFKPLGRMAAFLVSRLWLSQSAVHTFRSSCQMIHFSFPRISLMCKCGTSLRGNQWFLLRIPPTQTVASCVIIIPLRSGDLTHEVETEQSEGKAVISHMQACEHPKVKWLHIFIDFRAIWHEPLRCKNGEGKKILAVTLRSALLVLSNWPQVSLFACVCLCVF